MSTFVSHDEKEAATKEHVARYRELPLADQVRIGKVIKKVAGHLNVACRNTSRGCVIKHTSADGVISFSWFSEPTRRGQEAAARAEAALAAISDADLALLGITDRSAIYPRIFMEQIQRLPFDGTLPKRQKEWLRYFACRFAGIRAHAPEGGISWPIHKRLSAVELYGDYAFGVVVTPPGLRALGIEPPEEYATAWEAKKWGAIRADSPALEAAREAVRKHFAEEG